MIIDIFVVMTNRQFAKLSIEPVAADAIPSRRTGTCPSPVAQGPYDSVKRVVVGIDRATLVRCDMVGRIEAGCADVSYRYDFSIDAV